MSQPYIVFNDLPKLDALLPVLDLLGVPLAGWRQASAWGVVVLSLLATAIGFAVARMSPAVVHVDIPLDDFGTQYSSCSTIPEHSQSS